jgi:hypothetical protein
MISKTIAPKLAEQLYPLIARHSKDELEKTDEEPDYHKEEKMKKCIE